MSRPVAAVLATLGVLAVFGGVLLGLIPGAGGCGSAFIRQDAAGYSFDSIYANIDCRAALDGPRNAAIVAIVAGVLALVCGVISLARKT